MWGDPETAAALEESDDLVSLLYQVSGPSHVPWNDPRWQELLLGYDVWVHVEHTRQQDDVVSKACTSMAKHAPHSSNLAALCLHVSRMMRDLQATTRGDGTGNSFTDKIAMVGKARATAGSLNLLRTLIHDVPPTRLSEALLYQSRDVTDRSSDRLAGTELCTCLLNFVAAAPSLVVPELYDTMVISLQLLLVLLSSQLYQPMLSSTERKNLTNNMIPNYILDYIMDDARRRRQHKADHTWSPQSLLNTCLAWQIDRPLAPERSIAHHLHQLMESVVSAKGDKVGPDGMYETHVVVMAQKPRKKGTADDTAADDTAPNQVVRRSSSRIIMDATKGVSFLILLPFRLMTLALGLLGRAGGRHQGPEYDALRKQHISAQRKRRSNVFWLSSSPVADLSTSLFLVLVHNYRAGSNPFRAELAALNDDRWEDTEELASTAVVSSQNDSSTTAPLLSKSENPKQHLMTNFEALFVSFGSIVHTEVGALLLYSMYQSSPLFAASMAVRSDLDTLVVPLLRTLYFSSSLRHYTGTSNTKMSPLNVPFRSLSQVYLILILLLLFSQDASFGPDAFRRVMVSSVRWYRERQLKDITLGSLLLLTLLRAITFNLNRLQDVFLLSNCCAVLMNLSPNVVQLHDYAAIRLVNVTISSLKKYSQLVAREPGKSHDHEDLTTPMGMYGEIARTLVGILRHALSPKHLDKNLHLVYALVYHQADFHDVVDKPTIKNLSSDLKLVDNIIRAADKMIHDDGDARTAQKALKLLSDNVEKLQKASEKKQEADFTFSYEEEADPEIFFVPYIWEVIVCVVTASSIDWDTNRIQVFALIEDDEDGADEEGMTENNGNHTGTEGFAKDVSDIV